MNITQESCYNCGCSGYITVWTQDSIDETSNIRSMNSKKVVCKNCNGKGWIEYPIFSVEEAKAILKHCGLSTE